MKNSEIADILDEIADLLEMDDVQFKPRAYRKAARNIRDLGEDIEDIYKGDNLKDIPGIGESIKKKIIEFIETGKVKKLEELKKKTPVDIESLSGVEGLGPKRINLLHKKLGIENLDDLEKAAEKGEISKIENFGKTIEKKILENIDFARKTGDRHLLGYILPIANEIVEDIKSDAIRIELAGSIRRKVETVGDIDILATTKNNAKLIKTFIDIKDVTKILLKGEKKVSVLISGGIQVDLRIIEEDSFGAALQYFTGSKDHNVALRKIAIKKGYKLNEYGIFEGKKKIESKNEKNIYKTLSLDWIPPELRENRGEIKASIEKKLPSLIDYKDLKGDLHVHSNWSDGKDSIEDMVTGAKKLGHKFIAITDHIGNLKIAKSMKIKNLRKQMAEIEKIQEKNKDIHVFRGVEANIEKDGSIDISNEIIDEIDLVIGSIHSSLRMNKKEMTERLVNSIKGGKVDIIGHPTCRLINKRKEISIDMEKVLKAASDNNVIMEINAYPERLDLNDYNVKLAIEKDVKLSIGTDAHNQDQLKYFTLGVAVARRGWAKKRDIINTQEIKELKRTFKK
ncbi:MAG: DNA polymerase/3'-5' exonuclease PolX [Candidatus Methanofastidiosum sp.]|nr:DNA polymerase/3'-5' exonuclease PolX [Methanofastidiosum sp.]